MSTPAELRSLAARVAGGEATNEEIARAVGWRKHNRVWLLNGYASMCVPSYLDRLDAADLLMAPLRERGWRFSTMEVDREKVQVHGTRVLTARDIVKMRSGVGSYLSDTANAPTEPRARTALALLCRAVELEHADADQR